jgi:crotonobetainyl-CoA:carnitine CoA-transferase CaiB-like acyl-CoA transferase
MTRTRAVITDIWRAAGLEPFDPATLHLRGEDHNALPSTFAVGIAAQAAVALSGLAAANLDRVRTGRAQAVAVDRLHAAIAFRSERYLKLDTDLPPLWDPIAGLYPTADGRHVRIHTNFPHHRDGILALLGCANAREAVAAALMKWHAEPFENAAAEHGLVVTMTRSLAEWAAHPQGRVAAAAPPIELIRLGDAPPRKREAADRPLTGVRVLDLTRVIAGPVAARTLAAHGADVLHITSPKLPAMMLTVMDTGRGKRPAHLDLTDAADRATLAKLVAHADVFVQGYRPGGLAAKGFSPDDLARARPGIVCVALSAFGTDGPWANRRGFDSLTQNANGMNIAEAEAAGDTRPKELPAQALDHGAGYLLAFGAMAALARQHREGGSWLVRTSLAQVAEWIKTFGRIADGLATPEPTPDQVAAVSETTQSGFGRMTAIREPAELSLTPARFDHPSMPLGAFAATWA